MNEEKNWKEIYKEFWTSRGHLFISEMNIKNWEEENKAEFVVWITVSVIIILGVSVLMLLLFGD